MAVTPRRNPLYIVFLLVMALLCVAGVALLIYGSAHNGIPAPKLPGIGPRFAWLWHG